MATAKFLHAADLHLGSPLKSLGDSVDQETVDFVKARVNTVFQRLVDVAVEEKVDFIVLAGDIYDMVDRDPGAQRRFLLGLRRLDESGIKVFMAHGNHDPFIRHIPRGLLPDNVVVFPPKKLLAETVVMSNGVEVTVAGVSYGKKDETDNLVPLFANLSGRTIVGVLHTNVGGNGEHDNYAPSTVAELDASPVNYWALGHIHIRSVNPTRNGWWAYPGNLQGRSVKAAECGPKGVLIVEVDDDGSIREPRFVECAAVRFERVEVSVDDIDDIALVNDAVNDALKTLVADGSGLPILVRLELVGQTDLIELRSPTPESLEKLAADIREEASEVLGDGAIVKVRSSCVPRVDLVAERTRDTLLGNVLRALDGVEADHVVRDEATKILVNVLGAGR